MKDASALDNKPTILNGGLAEIKKSSQSALEARSPFGRLAEPVPEVIIEDNPGAVCGLQPLRLRGAEPPRGRRLLVQSELPACETGKVVDEDVVVLDL